MRATAQKSSVKPRIRFDTRAAGNLNAEQYVAQVCADDVFLMTMKQQALTHCSSHELMT